MASTAQMDLPITLMPRELNTSLRLSLVVPVYNEAAVIRLFIERIEQLFAQRQGIELEYVFINDGSTDQTLAILLDLQRSVAGLKVLDLSRNFGKEAAMTAGLQHVTGDVVVPIDVDLQDPPELIVQMLGKWREGYEVVLGRREDRSSDTWLKRASAGWFYRLHNQISDPVIPENVGDFRLMDRKVVDALNELPESRRFMKGLFAWVGYRTASVNYTRPERQAGESKFNGWKLWNLAIEGITSFSIAPLKIWTYLGVLVSLASFALAIMIVLQVLLDGVDVPGYASLMVAITFIGGLQLIGIGILGEYIGRTYLESKSRPAYLIRQIYERPAEHA